MSDSNFFSLISASSFLCPKSDFQALSGPGGDGGGSGDFPGRADVSQGPRRLCKKECRHTDPRNCQTHTRGTV